MLLDEGSNNVWLFVCRESSLVERGQLRKQQLVRGAVVSLFMLSGGGKAA